jgi:hypothetical protein
VEVLGQLGDALSIGLGLESEALALEQGLQLLVVGNNTIVDDSELPRRVGAYTIVSRESGCLVLTMNLPVRMAVGGGGGTVGSPSGVCNASVRVKDLLQIGARLINELLELDYLANLLEGQHLVLLVTINS